MSDSTFLGYRRPDGSVGIRNYVVVVSRNGLANALARRVASLVDGVIPITTPFGVGHLGPDRARQEGTLAALARHPNVAGVVVVGAEEDANSPLAEAVARPGLPVANVGARQEGGTLRATARAVSLVADMLIAASEQRREPIPLGELVIAMECGLSDTSSGVAANPAVGWVVDRVVAAGGRAFFSELPEIIGAEHILAARAVTPEVAEALLARVQQLEDYARGLGANVRENNPGPENIAGGLTTIEEKSLGAIAKGGTSPLQGVLDYGQPPPAPGFHFMDTPAFAVDSITGMAAAGAHLMLFTSGLGNPLGSPLAPTLKVTGNPGTQAVMHDHVDVDVSGVMTGAETLDQAGQRLLDEVVKVASGKLVRAEVLREYEVGISRLGPSI